MENAPTRVIREVDAVQAAIQPRETTCEDPNLCQKPFGSQNLSLPIGLGIGIPAALIVAFLFYLHRRNVKRVKLEDLNEAHRSLDFGMAANPGGKKKNRLSGMLGGEKDRSESRQHRNQMSMDMNLSSPYLLPPGLQQSRESLHSLARTLNQTDDPYRPVKYVGSDNGSLRSYKKDPRGTENSSLYTDSTGRDSRDPRTRGRKDAFPKQPHALAELQSANTEIQVHAAALPTPPPSAVKDRFMPAELPVEPDVSANKNADPFANAAIADFPMPAPPPRAAQRIPRKGLSPNPAQDNLPPTPESMTDSHHMQPFDLGLAELPQDRDLPQQAQTEPVGLGLMAPQRASIHMASPVQEPATINHHDSATLPSFPTIQEPEAQYNQQYGQDDFEGRGRAMHRRQSSEYPDEMPQTGLHVPQMNNKRMSVGFRPLPPDEMIEHEDPETRANRIRSFYKEYFDDSKGGDRQTQGPQYYEDYDAGYLGDAAFFDPDSNAFVMPYAQPVARRAMTPPPSGSRFPGPRGPPRPHHGSMGGASMGGRGPMRPGSSSSHRFQGPPRPGSSASARPFAGGRPRAGSAYSNQSGRPPFGKPRKPMPPPAALNSLPTPSKLKDDSFAIMGAMDFAPPPTYKDQAAGRSQSPVGERRPYQMNVPAASPLVSSYNDMSSLPSPHLLRKSSTFTGLDFAPPRRFKENGDAMSDAGSIRSNRSGISAVSRQAIRTGAGRVSRLPGDTVFTQAQLATTLKPEWGMRP